MGITPKAFKALVDKGLYVDYEALESGLIDALDYEDVLIEKINEQVTGDPKDKDLAYIKFDNYVAEMMAGQGYVLRQKRDRKKPKKAGKADVVYYVSEAAKEKQDVSGEEADAEEEEPAEETTKIEKSTAKKIALVYALGMIIDSSGVNSSSEGHVAFGGENVVAADEIAPALLDVAEDDSYGGVVLRIDSPGGSPVASETILRALQKVQEAGKSVTVSMGSMAASGGYWIASSAIRFLLCPQP